MLVLPAVLMAQPCESVFGDPPGDFLALTLCQLWNLAAWRTGGQGKIMRVLFFPVTSLWSTYLLLYPGTFFLFLVFKKF